MNSKFPIWVIPWGIENLGFANDFCIAYIVFHFQDIYQGCGAVPPFKSKLGAEPQAPPLLHHCS